MRIEFSPFAHPSHRTELSNPELAPYSRALLQGETNKDCIAISLAVQLLAGNGPGAVQSVFNSQVKDRLSKFVKANPDIQFKRCGRAMEGSPDEVKVIPRPILRSAKKIKAASKKAAKAKSKPKKATSKPKSTPTPQSTT